MQDTKKQKYFGDSKIIENKVTDHLKKVDLLRKYCMQIKTGFAFDLAGDIHKIRLLNAKNQFAVGLNEDSVLGFYDTSLNHSGSNGYLFTDTKVYYLETGGKPQVINYDEIKNIRLISKGKKDYNNELRFELENGTVKIWKSIFLNKTPLFEFFNELLKMNTGNDADEVLVATLLSDTKAKKNANTKHLENVELLEKYYQKIKTRFVFDLAEDIHKTRLLNAKTRFAAGFNEDSVLGFYDTSLNHDGSNGYLFTDTKVYYLETGGKPQVIIYDEIKNVVLISKGKKDYNNELRFELKNGTVKIWKSIFLNKTPLFEFFNELLKLNIGNDTDEKKPNKKESFVSADFFPSGIGRLSGGNRKGIQYIIKRDREEEEHMKTLEIKYDPYRMKTEVYINGIDVLNTDQNGVYDRVKEFIAHEIPLQTWIEPIAALEWDGLVNVVSDTERNDEVKLIFDGRKIDFEDLKRSIEVQNQKRSERTRVKYHYEHRKIVDDMILSKNIEEVVKELKSKRFGQLVEQRKTETLKAYYRDLDINYEQAKKTEFQIVFSGVYSSGKSTLLNSLMRHNILPISNSTCTTLNCKIRHDKTIGKQVSLIGYDNNRKIVVKKERCSEETCAELFKSICPLDRKNICKKYEKVNEIEIRVDLQHLYPEKEMQDRFTIVLIDTPGMDSADTQENGRNRHEEIALDAIKDKNKPMVILCVDANKYEDKSIGEFMGKIVAQTKEDGNGFNDRFLFVMNKSDMIQYNNNESPEDLKTKFTNYLRNSQKWDVESEQKELAANASQFVPRIFMTSALAMFAIQQSAFKLKKEDIKNDSEKRNLRKAYIEFKKNICGSEEDYEDENYYLSRYCDIPQYRLDEIEKEFETAKEEENVVCATGLQTGIIPLEVAIKDYVERYAYPIKVRSLLETFEAILDDVERFEHAVYERLKQVQNEMGEKNGERKEVREQKEGVKEKIAALEGAKEKINEQLTALNLICFDSSRLKQVIGDFEADIEADRDIKFFRNQNTVSTGQKSHNEVQGDLDVKISNIVKLFEKKQDKTNKELLKIKEKHDEQLSEILSTVRNIVEVLEQSGVLEMGNYRFTDNVIWKMNLTDVKTEQFVKKMKSQIRIVDKKTTIESVVNPKKIDWEGSWNPLKKVGALFMRDFIEIEKKHDGYYCFGDMNAQFVEFFDELRNVTSETQNAFEKALKVNKEKVCELIKDVIQECDYYWHDVEAQEKRIKELSDSIDTIVKEKKEKEDLYKWLNELKEKIKEK